MKNGYHSMTDGLSVDFSYYGNTSSHFNANQNIGKPPGLSFKSSFLWKWNTKFVVELGFVIHGVSVYKGLVEILPVWMI